MKCMKYKCPICGKGSDDPNVIFACITRHNTEKGPKGEDTKYDIRGAKEGHGYRAAMGV